jgi:uncharacterized protein YndB with AHSA1/START domain
MKLISWLLLFLVLAVAVVIATALSLPAHTTHTRTATLRQPPAKVFTVLADVQNMARWNRNTEKVELLPPVEGKEATRQTFKGGMVVTVITAESLPPNRLVRILGDAHAPFSGSWRYKITATAAGGSDVELTEISEISNPFYRLLVKIAGPTKYLDQHLEDLSKELEGTALARR